MKQYIFLITIFLLANFSFAQEVGPKEKKANEAFENFSYSQAIALYEALGVNSLTNKRNVALSYWKINDTEKAEYLFLEIVKMDEHIPLDVFNYAAVLRENKKYKEADEWMMKYAALNIADSRGQMYATEQGTYKILLKDKQLFTINNLDINTDEQDFGPSYYKDQVVFASSREGIKPIRRRWNRNELPFLDVYVADRGVDNNLEYPLLFKGVINKKYHEGPVAFNAAGDKMIFTRNNYNGKSTNGIVGLQLFSSDYKEGKWSDPIGLPFNNNEYSVGHATISSDGEWLYFASNMPGGFGGVDLYKAKMNSDGTYGEALNLGPKINTEGDEMFPFIHASKKLLFYASNGKIGLGGLDIFLAQFKEDLTVGKVINVGAPINSNADDFTFIIGADQTEGYFSSNRAGGKGSDDLYRFTLLKPFSFDKQIRGFARDKTGNILAGTKITLFDLITGEQESVFAEADGSYAFLVEADKTFNLRGAKATYFDGINLADTHVEREVVNVDVVLEKDPSLALYGVVTAKRTGKPLHGVKIKLIDNVSGESEEFNTTASGDFMWQLLTKKLNEKASYTIQLEKQGYLSKSVTYVNTFTKASKYEVHKEIDLSLEKFELGGDLSKIIALKSISFETNPLVFGPEAARELDKVVKLMNENPSLEIEVGAHTDAKGEEVMNQSVSDLKAQAISNYLKERISKPERVTAKGYGATKPLIIGSAVEGRGLVLTTDYINSFKLTDSERYEELHHMNRRIEYTIVRI